MVARPAPVRQVPLSTGRVGRRDQQVQAGGGGRGGGAPPAGGDQRGGGRCVAAPALQVGRVQAGGAQRQPAVGLSQVPGRLVVLGHEHVDVEVVGRRPAHLVGERAGLVGLPGPEQRAVQVAADVGWHVPGDGGRAAVQLQRGRRVAGHVQVPGGGRQQRRGGDLVVVRVLL